MLISQADLARAADVSRKSITIWKKRGTVVMLGEMVDVEKTIAAMRRAKRGGPAMADKVTAALAGGVTGNKGAPEKVTSQPEVTAGENDDPFPCRDHLTDPYHRGAVALLPFMAYRIGGCAALAAYGLGMEPEVAERLRLQVTTSAMELTAMLLEEAEVPPPPGVAAWHDAELYDADRVAFVDWARVAEVS